MHSCRCQVRVVEADGVGFGVLGVEVSRGGNPDVCCKGMGPRSDSDVVEVEVEWM